MTIMRARFIRFYEFRQEDNTRVKSTAAFDKQYLEGRYGADQCVSVFEVLANGKAESLHGCDWLDLCRVGIKEANTICVKCWIE